MAAEIRYGLEKLPAPTRLQELAEATLETLDILPLTNISGLGMDSNVIGRLRIPGQPEPDSPHVRMIIARDLSGAR